MKSFKKLAFMFTGILAIGFLAGCKNYDEETDLNFHKVIDYLYEVNYTKDLNYDKANQYFSKTTTTRIFSNSSVINGGFLGNNTNYYYSDCASIVVHTSAVGNAHATIGVIGAYDTITKSLIDSLSYKSYLQVLPFFINDGMNDSGVFMNMGAVPAFDLPDYKISEDDIKTKPSKGIEKTIYGDMLTRYVLDNFASASDAITYIQEHVSIVTNKNMYNDGFTHHYMIGDKTSSYLLEVFGTSFNVLKLDVDSGNKLAGKPYMSDFYLSLEDVIFNQDGKVTINKDELKNESGITPHGKGLERYNYTVQNYSLSSTVSGILSLMKDLKYGKCYDTSGLYGEIRYTDFVSKTLTNSELVKTYQPVINEAKTKYANKKRSDGKNGAIITSYCSIYDVDAKELYIDIDEQLNGKRFSI